MTIVSTFEATGGLTVTNGYHFNFFDQRKIALYLLLYGKKFLVF